MEREIFFFCLEEGRLWGSLNAAFSFLVCREGVEKVLPSSSQKCMMKGSGQRVQVTTGELPGRYRKNFCTLRVVKHCSRDCEGL